MLLGKTRGRTRGNPTRVQAGPTVTCVAVAFERAQSTFVRCLDPPRADTGEALVLPSERGGGERGGSVSSMESGKLSRSSSKLTSSALSRKKSVRIRLASLTTRYMVEPTITDETMAIWCSTRGGDAWGEARLWKALWSAPRSP